VANFALNHPLDIPWMLIAASPDMMATQYCNKRFPFAWRSSLAISAFEPELDDLPEELCDERITYIKITASITGYQPSREETERAYEFPNVPTEQLDRILSEYFACYGILLNAAVFPYGDTMRELERVCADFADQEPGTELPYSYQNGQTTGIPSRSASRTLRFPRTKSRGKISSRWPESTRREY
jgi:hypothetical protein